jgi:hypothetical protein
MFHANDDKAYSGRQAAVLVAIATNHNCRRRPASMTSIDTSTRAKNPMPELVPEQSQWQASNVNSRHIVASVAAALSQLASMASMTSKAATTATAMKDGGGSGDHAGHHAEQLTVGHNSVDVYIEAFMGHLDRDGNQKAKGQDLQHCI